MNKKALYTLMIAACSTVILSGCGEAQKNTAESKPAETVKETTVQETTEAAKAETLAETTEAVKEETSVAEEENVSSVVLQEIFKDAQYMEIGTTGYFIKVPKSYYQGDVKDNERKDDMIAYYKSDEFLMDFDVYQFPNEGRDLYAYTETEAKQYNADGITEVTINDTELGLYFSKEKYEGEEEYLVANYIFVSGNDFGELSFWQDGDEAEELTKAIINSITTTPEKASQEVQAQGDTPDYSFLMSEEYQKMVQAMIAEKVANTKLTLDKKDSSEDVNSLEDGHFITKDEVQCREVKIKYGDGATGERMYWFCLYLYNETGEPKDFDPTKFMIETKSGQLVYPCLMDDDGVVTVKSDTQTSHSFTLVDTKDLAPEEEASIYYDGVLISTVKVSP